MFPLSRVTGHTVTFSILSLSFTVGLFRSPTTLTASLVFSSCERLVTLTMNNFQCRIISGVLWREIQRESKQHLLEHSELYMCVSAFLYQLLYLFNLSCLSILACDHDEHSVRLNEFHKCVFKINDIPQHMQVLFHSTLISGNYSKFRVARGKLRNAQM